MNKKPNNPFTDKEKIKIFDQLFQSIKKFERELEKNDLTDDGEWELKNNLFYHFLESFSEHTSKEKRKVHQYYKNSIEEALDMYYFFGSDPTHFQHHYSVEDIFEKRQWLEGMKKEQILDMVSFVCLQDSDETLKLNFLTRPSDFISLFSVTEMKKKYPWFHKIAKEIKI